MTMKWTADSDSSWKVQIWFISKKNLLEINQNLELQKKFPPHFLSQTLKRIWDILDSKEVPELESSLQKLVDRGQSRSKSSDK